MDRIMIVEDDSVIREELTLLLQSNGYQTDAIRDFSDMTAFIREKDPHLILLDINLPVQDGFQVCSEIRTFSRAPIIFVTSRNTDMDELKSIMLGGDEFITKPYNTAILLARIASLLKRAYPSQQNETLSHHGVKLNLESGIMEHEGMSVDLTKNEMKIMAYLFKNAGKIVSRADLTESLWDSRVYIDDNTLSVNITRLREKLKRIGAADFIRTKHRQGYMI